MSKSHLLAGAALLALVLGTSVGLSGVGAPSVMAQTEPTCPYSWCDFTCSVQTHPWTQDGVDGIWVVVPARPVIDGGQSVTDARWYDNGDPSWPPMKIEVTWSRSGSADITSWAEVDNLGACSYEHTEGDYILCHDFKGVGSSDLCDGYGGIWDRLLAGGVSYCLSGVDYGFDLRKQIEYDSAFYCVESVQVTSIEPGSTGLKGRTEALNGGCGSVLDWSSGSSHDDWFCYDEEQRPGGWDSVYMEPLYYYYETP